MSTEPVRSDISDPTPRVPLRPLINESAQRLAAAGVQSARSDAEQLAAHLLGVARTRLALTPLVEADFVTNYQALVAQRAGRIPLQHILGTAAMGSIELRVGPGVFIPRPETELLFAWALAWLETYGHDHPPVVVDLCSGSGALALAIAHARPDVVAHAVELDESALVWTRRNAEARASVGDAAITVHAADVTAADTLRALDGTVDLIVANPPYIPDGARLDPEVRDHDPHAALFGGPDGLDVVRGMVPTIERLIRPGGAVAIEHDDSNGTALARLLRDSRFDDVAEHLDLAGKPRFVTAHRPAASSR